MSVWMRSTGIKFFLFLSLVLSLKSGYDCECNDQAIQTPSNVTADIGDVANLSCTLVTGRRERSDDYQFFWHFGETVCFANGETVCSANGEAVCTPNITCERFQVVITSSATTYTTTLVIWGVREMDFSTAFHCIVTTNTCTVDSSKLRATVYLLRKGAKPNSGITTVIICIVIATLLMVIIISAILYALHRPQVKYMFRRHCRWSASEEPSSDKDLDAYLYFDDKHQSYAERIMKELSNLGYRAEHAVPGESIFGGMSNQIHRSSNVILICSQDSDFFTSVVGKALEQVPSNKIIFIKIPSSTMPVTHHFVTLTYLNWPYEDTCDKKRKTKQFIYSLKWCLGEPIKRSNEDFDLSESRNNFEPIQEAEKQNLVKSFRK